MLVAAGLVAVVVTGCGNFFPNADNVVLPSGVRDYELVCGTVPRGECEARAAKIVAEKRNRVVKVEIQARGSYTITYADGTGESLIVD